MCLQDLEIGSNRYAIITSNTGSAVITIKPNRRRVAIMFGMNAAANTGRGLIYAAAGIDPAKFVGIVSQPSGNLILRLEDFGTLVTGPFTLSPTTPSSTAGLSIVEILTDIKFEKDMGSG
jgi:hypothetical protein